MGELNTPSVHNISLCAVHGRGRSSHLLLLALQIVGRFTNLRSVWLREFRHASAVAPEACELWTCDCALEVEWASLLPWNSKQGFRNARLFLACRLPFKNCPGRFALCGTIYSTSLVAEQSIYCYCWWSTAYPRPRDPQRPCAKSKVIYYAWSLSRPIGYSGWFRPVRLKL
jgi:hypothetical protein